MLSGFFSLELLIQGIGMLTALLIVRNMPKEQYAIYSLANGMQEALLMATSVGLGTALLAIGGERLGDRCGLGAVVAAGMKQRMLFLSFAAPVIIPLFGYLLFRNGAGPWEVGIIGILALAMLYQGLWTQLTGFSFGLRGEYNVTQKAQVGTGLLRLLLVGALLLGGFLFSLPAFAVAVIAGFPLLAFYLYPQAKHHVDFSVTADADTQLRMRRIGWRLLPNTLSALLQGQLAMWILAGIGNTEGVADLGALTRLGLLLALPSAFVTKVLRPRLARETSMEKLRQLCKCVAVIAFLFTAAYFITTCLLSDYLAYLLGDQYKNVAQHIPLYAGYTAQIFFGSCIFAVIDAKGWVKNSWIVPLVVNLGQVVALLLIPVTSIEGAILLRWFGDGAGFLVMLYILFNGFRGTQSV